MVATLTAAIGELGGQSVNVNGRGALTYRMGGNGLCLLLVCGDIGRGMQYLDVMPAVSEVMVAMDGHGVWIYA